MKSITKVTRSAEETILAAKLISQKIKAGSVVALQGNLGAGKTTFIKGLALGFGLKNPDEVKSPTFALMHTYETVPVLYHFDLYRLEQSKDILNIGLEEFISDPSAVTCIEWPEKADDLLPPKAVRVKIEIKSPTERAITVLL